MTAAYDYSKDLVDIKGKKYQPVASRLRMALGAPPEIVARLKGSVLQSCTTEVLYNTEKYLGVKVSIRLKEEYGGGIFDGVAESDRGSKSIEGDSSLEVAETSALGRALVKAGIAIDLVELVEMASADEMKNRGRHVTTQPAQQARQAPPQPIRQQQTNAAELGLLKDQQAEEDEAADPRHIPDLAIWGADKKTGVIRSRATYEGWLRDMSPAFTPEMIAQMDNTTLKNIVREELDKKKRRPAGAA